MRVTDAKTAFVWLIVTAIVMVPVILAATSPLLAWRDTIYIAAGFAGIIAMGLLFVQPLLATGVLPGLHPRRSRYLHRIVGSVLVTGVAVHVVGLYFTSPPDVIDVLLFRSPTPFSVWGMIGLIGIVLSTILVLTRRKLRLRHSHWTFAHVGLSTAIVFGTVIHAWLIQGTMETVSKAALSALILGATAFVITTTFMPRR